MSKLTGKVVWLTGASAGIGEAVAQRLATYGCRLALTARNRERLEEIAREMNRSEPLARVEAGDVTDREQVRAIASHVREAWGGIDVLITSAGTYIPTDGERFSSEHCEAMMQLNFFGTLYCIEAVLPGMFEQGGGHLVGISSLTGYRGLPKAAGYGATKAALINFLESLRFDLRDKNIAVTIVNPGFVRTPLTDKNEFRMPFLIEADRAAKIIVKGIERQKREIHFPAPFSWTVKLLRILPYRIYEGIIFRKVLRQ